MTCSQQEKMKCLLAAMLILPLAACESTRPTVVPENSKPMPTAKQLQDEWYNGFTRDADNLTDETNTCISEMYARVFSAGSVSGGPACREACKQLRAINHKVETAPSYIPDGDRVRLRLGYTNWCHAPK